MENPQEYYMINGPLTAPDVYAAELAALPSDLASICEVIQGLLIHRDLASLTYDVSLTQERRDDAHIRSTAAMLARLKTLDGRPLEVAREPCQRMAAVCRHFAVMLCTLLRTQGVPARVRCGFGAYLNPGKFEDHWVCEYWNAKQARWILVDAQLDAVQCKLFHADFDPLDVPRDRFILAGDAWRLCRAGCTEPHRFGFSYLALQGWWFVAGNVLRDIAALNRMELLPWDVWGLMPKDDAGLSEESEILLDYVAAITLAGDEKFAEVRAVYTDERLTVPPVVFNALRNAPETIADC